MDITQIVDHFGSVIIKIKNTKVNIGGKNIGYEIYIQKSYKDKYNMILRQDEDNILDSCYNLEYYEVEDQLLKYGESARKYASSINSRKDSPSG
ncbi:MAG: hypothetical protein ACOCQD_01880 [archaeon]